LPGVKVSNHAGVFTQSLAAGNAGWPSPFRFAVHGFWPGMAEL
jgi:hypothetical protein